MMLWALLLLLLASLVVEAFTMRKSGLMFVSPMTVFVASFLFTYGIPLFLSDYSKSEVSRLNSYQHALCVEACVNFLAAFFVASVIISFPLSLRIGAQQGMGHFQNERFVPTRRQMQVMFILAVIALLFHLGAGVGFNPATMLHRIAHPRLYTHTRAGTGLVIYIRAAVTIVFLSTLARYAFFRARRSLDRNFCILAATALTLAGGSKSSLIIVFISLILGWQSKACLSRFSAVTVKRFLTHLAGTVGVTILGITVLLVSFSAMDWGHSHKVQLIDVSRIVKYSREASNTAKVLDDYEGDIGRLATSLYDTAIYVVPRKLFPNKPVTGMYGRYWKPMYESNRVDYHASTFGCLAEAHMLFGYFGPFVYGAFFAALVGWVTDLMYRCRNGMQFSVVLFFVSYMYFLVRGGLTCSVTVYVALVLSGAAVLHQVLRSLDRMVMKQRRLPAERYQ